MTDHPQSELIVEQYKRNLTERELCAQFRMAHGLVLREDIPKFILDQNIPLVTLHLPSSGPWSHRQSID